MSGGWTRSARARNAALVCSLAAAVSAFPSAAHGQIALRVDPGVPLSGDGLTWATAFKGIKSAVVAAQSNSAVTEIWVKQGTYHPGADPYLLRNGLALLGGFEGDETAAAQRDPEAFPTVLTGNGVRRIMNLDGLGSTVLVDGFTLRDGYSAVDGAAVFGGTATFRNCRFVANHARVAAAWYGFPGRARFVGCHFEANTSVNQGAVTEGRGADFVNCTFVDNTAGFSGCVRTYDGLITLANCTFVGNDAGLSNLGHVTGAVETHEGTVVAVHCTFVGNAGAALRRTDPVEGSVVLANSVVWDNTLGGPIDASHSCVEGGASGEGNIALDPRFVARAARDLRLGDGSPAIDAGSSARLPADIADLDGDGDLAEPLPLDALRGARVLGKRPDLGAFEHFPDCDGDGTGDEAEIAAGAADLDGNGVPDACEDCNANGAPDALDIASGASADCGPDGIPDECQIGTTPFDYAADDGVGDDEIGGNLYVDFAWMSRFTTAPGAETVREVSIAFGSGLSPGAAARVCLWRDPDGDGLPDDAQLRTLTYASVANPGGAAQSIDVPDTFMGPAGSVFFVGVLVAGQGSLAPIDRTGTAQGESWVAVSAIGTLDPARPGDADILIPIAQAGFEGDWLVRAHAVLDGDCDGNGVPDACDAAGGGADCQDDGIPDGCQLAGNDCDADGVPDDCELASGTLRDCNANGLPDPCDISTGTSVDLDGNGVPDECEDCDANGLPDGLDIALGAADCQPDGIPDRCQLGEALPDAYAVDEGVANFYVSSDAPNMAWLNHFTVEEGLERISAVNAMYGPLPEGSLVRVHVWSDPNGDGDPSDARSLASAPHVVAFPAQGRLERTAVPETFIGPPGTGFFVGVIASFTPLTHYPASKDNQPPLGVSWLVGSYGAIEPDDLPADADEFLRIDDLGGNFVGVWILRAEAIASGDCNANGVPDACDIEDGTLADADGDGVPDGCGPCIADLDADRQVGASDLALLLGAWGADGAGDLDGSGQVGAPDLALLLGAWGSCR